MNDDMYEKFEVTDWDLQNEFNPNRNNGRRGKKSDAIYGKLLVSRSFDVFLTQCLILI